jgi:hypothetical protein
MHKTATPGGPADASGFYIAAGNLLIFMYLIPAGSCQLFNLFSHHIIQIGSAVFHRTNASLFVKFFQKV